MSYVSLFISVNLFQVTKPFRVQGHQVGFDRDPWATPEDWRSGEWQGEQDSDHSGTSGSKRSAQPKFNQEGYDGCAASLSIVQSSEPSLSDQQLLHCNRVWAVRPRHFHRSHLPGSFRGKNIKMIPRFVIVKVDVCMLLLMKKINKGMFWSMYYYTHQFIIF